MDTAALSNTALLIITLLGMYTAAFWLALIIWTYRDHRARSRDGLASLAAALTVTILGLPGLLVYLLLRPKETLSETYERSLEEEALLQEIEEKPICPGCGRPSQVDWQLCPYCHTTLKRACINCNQMLELSWQICPYCAANQQAYAGNPAAKPDLSASHQPSTAYRNPTAIPPTEPYAQPGPTLEYIDDDPYQR